MSDDIRIPLVEEQAHVEKRRTAENVRVRTTTETEHVIMHDAVRREQIEVTRVPIEREVPSAPSIRIEGDVTIVPVLEERLVVERRLFLVEEIHLVQYGERRLPGEPCGV